MSFPEQACIYEYVSENIIRSCGGQALLHYPANIILLINIIYDNLPLSNIANWL